MSMTKAQPRHPSTGRFVAKAPVKQAKPKADTPQQQKSMPKSGKK
jgi:hypothetical protein